MYGSKEKKKHYNDLLCPDHASADLALLKVRDPYNSTVILAASNPARKHDSILFALLDTCTREEIVANRRSSARSETTIKEVVTVATFDSIMEKMQISMDDFTGTEIACLTTMLDVLGTSENFYVYQPTAEEIAIIQAHLDALIEAKSAADAKGTNTTKADASGSVISYETIEARLQLTLDGTEETELALLTTVLEVEDATVFNLSVEEKVIIQARFDILSEAKAKAEKLTAAEGNDSPDADAPAADADGNDASAADAEVNDAPAADASSPEDLEQRKSDLDDKESELDDKDAELQDKELELEEKELDLDAKAKMLEVEAKKLVEKKSPAKKKTSTQKSTGAKSSTRKSK